MPIPEKFLTLLSHPNPALAIKFSHGEAEEPIVVGLRNSLSAKQETAGRHYIESINENGVIDSLSHFYERYGGGGLFAPHSSPNIKQTPLIQFVPAALVRKFTAQYEPGGDRAWIMEHNKTKAIYRGADKWIAFAQVVEGPSCLCIFLSGENAGGVFFAEPQPHFNTLKPIAKNFNIFLERIAKDPASLLRLIRAYVTVKQHNNSNFGYYAVSYLPNASGILPIVPENRSVWKRIFR
jgi:hypothetical protein